MKLLLEVNLTEVDNVEKLRSYGWGNVDITKVLEAFREGWLVCNKACPNCGTVQFFKDGKVKCLACGGG